MHKKNLPMYGHAISAGIYGKKTITDGCYVTNVVSPTTFNAAEFNIRKQTTTSLTSKEHHSHAKIVVNVLNGYFYSHTSIKH